VSYGAGGGVAVKSAPGSALVVVEADLLFALIVIALDASGELGESDERNQ